MTRVLFSLLGFMDPPLSLANMMAFWVGHDSAAAIALVKRSHVSILAGMLLLGNEIPFAEIG